MARLERDRIRVWCLRRGLPSTIKGRAALGIRVSVPEPARGYTSKYLKALMTEYTE